MMSPRRLAIIDGHPDPDPGRFVHALAESYAKGAAAAGHEARRIKIAELEFPLIGSRHDWEGDYLPTDIRHAQEAIAWAEHADPLSALARRPAGSAQGLSRAGHASRLRLCGTRGEAAR